MYNLAKYVAVGAWLTVACGGSKETEPVFPATEAPPPEEAPDPTWETEPQYDDGNQPERDSSDSATKTSQGKPKFTSGMSVNEAISAVPSHYDFVGIEQEVLAKPLIQPETYKECGLTPSDHFSVRIAVWDGKVVGADVDAKKPEQKSCIERVVRAIEYDERVESINTVEYSF